MGRLTFDKTQVLTTLRGAGIEIKDEAADAVYAGLSTLLPQGEVFTGDEMKGLRKENEARRLLVGQLAKAITGKEITEYPEEGRYDAAVQDITKTISTLKKTGADALDSKRQLRRLKTRENVDTIKEFVRARREIAPILKDPAKRDVARELRLDRVKTPDDMRKALRGIDRFKRLNVLDTTRQEREGAQGGASKGKLPDFSKFTNEQMRKWKQENGVTV